jgi:hypothetical protein
MNFCGPLIDLELFLQAQALAIVTRFFSPRDLGLTSQTFVGFCFCHSGGVPAGAQIESRQTFNT